jgi:hypothetical protein
LKVQHIFRGQVQGYNIYPLLQCITIMLVLEVWYWDYSLPFTALLCIVSTFISISLFKYLIYKYSQNVPFLSNNLKQIVWKYYYSCGTHFCWISGGLKLHNLKSNEIHFHWFNTIYSRAQWSLSGFDTNSVIVVQCPPNFIEDCLKLCNE